MDDLERRVMHLELASSYERQRLEDRLAGISHRLQHLESRPGPFIAVPPATVLKIIAAILMPLATLASTGSLGRLIRTILQAAAGAG